MRPSASPLRGSFGSLRSAALVALLALGACTPEKPPVTPDGTGPGGTGTAAPGATAGSGAGAGAAAGPDVYTAAGPFALEAFPAGDPGAGPAVAVTLPPSPAGVAPAPASCGEALKIKVTEAPKCDDAASALAALDGALRAKVATDNPATDEAARRSQDASLAALEQCAALPAGLVRALRIELGPVECGDVLAEPLLAKPPKEMRADVADALHGLALAARFARAGGAMPALAAPYPRDKVDKFTKGPLAKWMKDVAQAVQDMSGNAAKLSSYGGAVAAVAAGVADLSLVEKVRAAPIPDEFQKDEERKNIYYAALDEGLEPRKKRGRDAALTGLKKFAEVGSLRDARVAEARRLLSKLYGGRRIDALDRLLVPAVPAGAASSVEQRLAEKLPTFYAGLLLAPKLAQDPAALAGFARAGLPMPHRKALAEATVSPEVAPLAVHASLALGRTYWRASDFEAAAKASTSLAGPRSPEHKLLAALAIAMRNGPKDAIEMMVKSPLGMSSLGQRAALDALTAEKVSTSGAAAFDAAYLMEIAAPERADGLFFKSVAKRYHAAAELLASATEKAEAEERAKAVEAISGQVQ